MKGKPRIGWMDGVKRVTNERGMCVEQERMTVHDRSGGSYQVVGGTGHEFNMKWQGKQWDLVVNKTLLSSPFAGLT